MWLASPAAPPAGGNVAEHHKAGLEGVNESRQDPEVTHIFRISHAFRDFNTQKLQNPGQDRQNQHAQAQPGGAKALVGL